MPIDAELDYSDAVAEFWLDLADASLGARDLETCLRYAHIAALVLSRQNRHLFSPRIEYLTREVATLLFPSGAAESTRPRSPSNPLSTLHVLSEALPAGGLTAMATRWIAAASDRTTGHVALLSTDLPTPAALADAVFRSGGSIHLPLDPTSFVATAQWLRKLAGEVADQVVLHIDVSDVICGAAFNSPGGPPVVLVNHTAHTFWTGVSYIDQLANCRASALEIAWAESFRDVPRHTGIPIPLPPPVESLRAKVRAALGIPESAVVLITVGARFKYLATEQLDFVQVLEAALHASPVAHLLVVGFAADQRWSAAARQTDQRIRVLGTLDHDHLIEIYGCADIYVEGFPFGTTTALLEAASMGNAAILAPSLCPPPYSTDGIAIDGVVLRTNSVGSYLDHLRALIEDRELRSAVAVELQDAVLRHHTGPGWRAHLRDATARLPNTHGIYEIGTAAPTPPQIYRYWTRFAPAWSWSYGETLEHSLLRAISIGLAPTINRDARSKLRAVLIATGGHRFQFWLVVTVTNFFLPNTPIGRRAAFFRVSSYLARPYLLRRLGVLLDRACGRSTGGGAYAEYRTAALPLRADKDTAARVDRAAANSIGR